jgi:hypothetical protein
MSTTHYAKAIIRLASLCAASSGRSEQMRSAIAITKNSINRETGEAANLEKGTRVLRGSQFVSQGNLGERTKKANGESEITPETEGRVPRGSERASHLLKTVLKRQQTLAMMDAKTRKPERKRLAALFQSNSEDTHTAERRQDKVSQLRASMALPQRRLNKRQKETGVYVTAAVDGKLLFKELTAALHKTHMIEECKLRGSRAATGR